MTDHSDRWPAVAAAVKARMEALGYFDNAPFVRASGLSEPFVRGVLSGAPRGTPRRSSLMRMCKALGWTSDSIERILAGQPPALSGGTPAADEQAISAAVAHNQLAATVQRLEGEVSQLRRWVVALGERQGLVLDELDADEPPSLAATPAEQDDGRGLR